MEMECIPDKNVTMRYKAVMGQASGAFSEDDEKADALDTIIMTRHS